MLRSLAVAGFEYRRNQAGPSHRNHTGTGWGVPSALVVVNQAILS
jgi:hypothetical protein